MKKITALRAGRGRGKRINIFLDDKFAFSLEAEVAAKEGLRVEQALSDERIEAVTRADHYQRCLNAAIDFLSYRPRSESELRVRLGRRGFESDAVKAVIARLKEQGMVNDTAFAQFWKDNRETFSPRSQWLTRLELRQKGIANEVIDPVVESIDEDNSAYRAGLSKARRLPRSDYESFRRRLGQYLKQRGFGYRAINGTVERLWQEQESGVVELEADIASQS